MSSVASHLENAGQQSALLRNRELLKQLALQGGLVSAALAATARGGMGLYNVARRAMTPTRPSLHMPRPLDVPVPAIDEEQDKAAMQKQANPPTPPGLLDDPRALPFLLGSSALGAVGGWKLFDHLLDKRRKTQLEAEVSQAQRQYEQALRGQHKLAATIDRLYDELQKQAEGPLPPLTNWSAEKPLENIPWGLMGGMGLSAMGLIGLMGGVGGYDLAKKRNRSVLLEKARKQRAREQLERQPQPFFARPVPIEE